MPNTIIKVFGVTLDAGQYFTKSLKDALYNAEVELEENMSTEVSISVHEMTQEEFDAIPEQ